MSNSQPRQRPLPHHTRRVAALACTALASLLLTACSSHPVQVPWLNFPVRVPGEQPSPSLGQGAVPTPVVNPSGQAAVPVLSIQQFIPIAKHFVEQHRGLTFKADVPVTLLDDAAFKERLLGKSSGGSGKTPSEQVSIASRELKALHLIDKGVDLGAATDSLLGAGVSGFYDSKSKSLVVRGTSATPYVRQVLVHELTHAVQDQYFGIDRPALNAANDEQASAFQAVFEGDAVRIEDQYHSAMSTAEQQQSDREAQAQGGGLPPGTPQVLLELISFPYIVGPDFVRTLDQVGGQARVDDAFVHPPTTSAQLINVNRFLHGDGARPVPAPKADAPSFDTSVLGEFGLVLLLERTPGGSSSAALRAGDLWGGDSYVAWNSGSGACVRDNIVADTPADQPQLDAAISAWATGVTGATFTAAHGGLPGQITACG
ncbi:MAG TPA: hypothetical protein VN193_07070 [Candidatus Angelobacter sp.]|jgi:hypothetical protein|nr:hypothetical protein [Candidatus Angelobacter sp.]